MALVAFMDGSESQENNTATTETEGTAEVETTASTTTEKEKGGKETKSGGGTKNEAEVTVESIARELGWTPKDEFRGNPDDYVDAATYIRRSKDIAESKNNQIGSLKRQLKEISAVVNDLKMHNERVYKAEVKKLEGELAELKKERKAAISDGDADKVEEIEQKMSELHTEAMEFKSKAEDKKTTDADDGEVAPVFVEWKKENPWYLTDKEMTLFADKIAERYEGAPIERILKIVSEEAKRVFPDKFPESDTKASSKAAPNPVESGSRRTAAKTRFTEADLTSAQRETMRRFVKHGACTKEDYIKGLIETGELS